MQVSWAALSCLLLTPQTAFAHPLTVSSTVPVSSPARILAHLANGNSAVSTQSNKLTTNHNGLAVLSTAQLNQLLSSGAKSLTINGGSFSGDLVIPRGVTLIDIVSKGTPSLNLSGNLDDSGKLLFLANNNQAGQSHYSAELNARSIFVNSGGMISTGANLGLSIRTSSNLTNAGIIASAADLNLNAGGSISNCSGAVSRGDLPVPRLTAAQNISLSAGAAEIRNSGLINAINGSVSIVYNGSLDFNNFGGTIKAANAVNFNDAAYSGGGNLNINGGNFLSQTLNLNAGSGTVNASVDQISGIVNVNACNSHLGAVTPDLKLGVLNVKGDPTYYNTGGDVNISSNITTNGADLAILASGNINITGASTTIDTSSATASSGNCLMVAGAKISGAASGEVDNDTTTTITISPGLGSGGGSNGGGSINFTGLGLNTAGTAGFTGGNVVLVAYSGQNAGTGSINLSVPVTTGSGSAAGGNGNFTAIAGATSGTAISLNSVTTGGSASDGSGSIFLSTASPLIQGGNITVTNGTASGGTFVQNAMNASSITASGALTSGTGASIHIAAGGNITFNVVGTATNSPNGNTALLSGGNIVTQGGPGTFTTLGPAGAGAVFMVAGANLSASGLSTVVSAGSGSGGGSSAGGSITLSSGSIINTIAGASNTSGGNVTLAAYAGNTAGSGTVSLGGPVQTGGNGSGQNGTVLVLAGATSGAAISEGGIDTTGATSSSTGIITLQNASPKITGGPNITVTNAAPSGGSFAAGNIQSGSINLSAAPLNTNGGAVNVVTNGSITLATTISTSTSANPGQAAGTITLTAGGTLSVLGGASGAITASSTGTGSAGGQIAIAAQSIIVGGSGPLQLVADGDNTVSGGSIQLMQTGASSLTIGSAASGNNVQLSAHSPNAGGQGGIITVSSGGDLIVDPNAITAAANVSGNGKGAQISLTAGAAGSGNLQISSGLDASGGPAGNGGSLTLVSASSNAFTVGGSSGNFINGTLSANAGLGTAGAITITNTGNGGIKVSNPGNLVILAAGTSGNGGTIDLEAGLGTLTIGTGTLSANSVGTGTGGVVTLRGTLVLPAAGLTVSSITGTITISTPALLTTLAAGNSFSGQNIYLAAPLGGFSISPNVLSATSAIGLVTSSPITAASLSVLPATPTLILGTTNSNSSIGTSTAPLSVNAANLTLSSAGSVFVTDSSTGDLSGNVNLIGALILGTPLSNSASGTFSVVASGVAAGKNLTLSAGQNLSAGVVSLTSSGGISLSANLNCTNSVVLVANNGSLQTGVGVTLTAPAELLAVAASGANIGAGPGNRLQINAAAVTAQASQGSVFVSDVSAGDASGNINLVNFNLNGTVFQNSAASEYSFQAGSLPSGNNLQVINDLSANDIVLNSSGGLNVSANLHGSNSISLISFDTLRPAGVISAPNILLATTGQFSNVGSGTGSRFLVNTPNLTVSVAGGASNRGSAWVADVSTGDINGNINLVNSTVDGTLYQNTAGAAGGVKGTFSLLAQALATGKTITTQVGVDINAANIDLTTTGGFNLAGNINGTASVALISHDSISSASISGTITSPTLLLATTSLGANIGSAANRLNVSAANMTLVAPGGSLFILDSSTGDSNGNVNLINSTVNLSNYTNSAGGTFSVICNGIASGKFLKTQAGVNISAKDIDLTTQNGGGIFTQGNVTGTNSVALISNDAIDDSINTGYGKISAPSITLAATGAGYIQFTNNELAAANLTLQAIGNVNVTDQYAGDANGNVNLVNSTVNGVAYTNQTLNSFILSTPAIIAIQPTVTVSAAVDIQFSARGFNVAAASASSAVLTFNSTTPITTSSFSGSLQCSNLTLNAPSIGTSANNLTVSANSLSVSAQSAFITDTSSSSVNLSLASLGPGTASISAPNVPSGQNLSWQANSNNSFQSVILSSGGGISISNSLPNVSLLALLTHDPITTASFSASLSASSLLLVSSADIGSVNSRLPISASNLTLLSTGGNVFVTNSSTGNVNIVNTAIGNVVFNNGAAGTFSLINNAITSGQNTITKSGVNLNAASLDITSSGGLSLAGNVTATNSVSLISHDSITSSSIAGTLSTTAAASTVTLAATGAGASIGAVNSAVTVNAPNLNLSAANGSVFVNDSLASGTATLVNNTVVNSTSYSNSASATGTYSVTASKAALSTGSTTLAAATVNLSAPAGNLTVTGANISAQNIILSSPNNTLTISDNTLSALAQSNGAGGVLSITAATISGGLTAALSLTANGSTAGGGHLSISSLNPLTLSNSTGSLVLSANAGGSGSGGVISVSTQGSSAINVDPSSISAAAVSAGDGGQLSLSAGGVLNITGTPSFGFNGAGSSGNGGQITLQGNTIAFNGSQPLQLTANGGSLAAGGVITVNSQSNASSLNVAPGNGNINVSATGGSGGIVSVASGGSLSFSSSGVTADPTNGNGAQITMKAGGTLTLNNSSYSYNAVGTGSGGLIDFEGGSISSGTLTLTANAVSTGDGGKIVYSTKANSNLSIDQGGLLISAKGVNAGNGGSITVATAGILSVNTSDLTLNPGVNQGNGATIDLQGSVVKSTTGTTLVLDVGSAAGSGGSITVVETTTSPQTVQAGGNFNFSGLLPAGTVSLSTGGNLTVDPGFLIGTSSVTGGSESSRGMGAVFLQNITLKAGTAGPGSLLVSGGIDTSGSIILQSNSSTPFVIGAASKGTNQVGYVNPAHSNNDDRTNPFSSIQVTNLGGGITDSQISITANSISFNTGNNGPLTINGSLINGSAGVSLIANGKGTVTDANLLQGGNVTISSGSGNISLANLDTSNGLYGVVTLNCHTGGAGTINVTGKVNEPDLNGLEAALLQIAGASAGSGSISVTASGGTFVTGPVLSAGTVSITGTLLSIGAGTDGTKFPQATVSGSTVNLNSVLQLTNYAAITGGSITEKASGSIVVNAPVTASSTGSANLTSSTGSIVSTADISGATVTLLAPKGSCTLGTIGQNQANNVLTQVGTLNGITNNGVVKTAGQLLETVSGLNSNITVNANIVAKQSVQLNASGAGDQISVSSGADISGSGTIGLLASSGSLTFAGSIGQNSLPSGNVSLQAASSLISDGLISVGAKAAVMLKSTGTTPGTGVINIGGSSDLSTAPFTITGRDISISTANSIGSVSSAVSLSSSNSLSVESSTGLVNINNISPSSWTLNSAGAATTLKIASTSGITVGSVTATTSITLTAPSITVSGTIGSAATSSLTINTTGAAGISELAGGLLQVAGAGGAVAINASASSVGSGGAPLVVNSPQVSVGTTGGIFVTDDTTGAASLVLTKPSAQSLVFSTNGDLSTTAAITTPSSITLSSVSGNINLGGNLGTTTTAHIFLNTAGLGTINPGTFVLKAKDINLTQGIADFGTASTAFQVTASGSLSIKTSGAVNVKNLGTSPLTLNDSNAGTSFTLSTGTNLTVNDISPATNGGVLGNVSLITTGSNNSIILNGLIVGDSTTASVSLVATGTGSIQAPSIQRGSLFFSEQLSAASVSLASGSGNIDPVTISAPLLLVSDGGKASVNVLDNFGIQLSPNSTFGSGNLTLSSFGNILSSSTINTSGVINFSSRSLDLGANITASSFTANSTQVVVSGSSLIKGTTVTLTTTAGSVGSLNNPVAVDTATLSTNSNSATNVLDKNTGVISVSGTTGSIYAFNTAAKTTTITSLVAPANQSVTLQSSNGSFLINGGITGTTVISAINGNITGSGTITGPSVNLSTTGASGSIGGTLALNTNTSNLSANTAPVGTGSVNLSNNGSGALTVGNSSAAGAFTLRSSGNTTLNNISAGNGNLSITAGSGLLSTNSGALLTANNGSLTLLNSSKTGTITIGASSQLITSGTKGGSVSIGITSVFPPVPGPAPASGNYSVNGMATTPTPPFFFFGSKGITVFNGAFLDMNVVGKVSVIFNAGSNASNITVLGGSAGAHTIIQADPPINAPTTSFLSEVVPGAPAVPAQKLQIASAISTQDAYRIEAVNSENTPKATTSASAASKFDQTALLSREQAQSATAGWLTPSNQSQTWPIVSNLQLKTKEACITEKTNLSTAEQSTLLAAENHQEIQTAFGSVKLDKGSLVLIKRFSRGIAVYDLDDRHRGSVSISVNGNKFELSPGRSLVVTASKVSAFAEANPIKEFSFRDVRICNLANGQQAFSSEFSLPTAVSTLPALREALRNNDPRLRKLVAHLLKTIAASQQINSGRSAFEPAVPPAVAAWAQ